MKGRNSSISRQRESPVIYMTPLVASLIDCSSAGLLHQFKGVADLAVINKIAHSTPINSNVN